MNDILAWLGADRFRVACLTVFASAAILGVAGCTGCACQSMTVGDAERAKWRAYERAADPFWNRNANKGDGVK